MCDINDSNLACRVCGYIDGDEPRWGTDGNSPNFTICWCCGAEAGYEDCLPISASRYRAKWLLAGTKWWEEKRRPVDWDLEQQLKQVPAVFWVEIPSP